MRQPEIGGDEGNAVTEKSMDVRRSRHASAERAPAAVEREEIGAEIAGTKLDAVDSFELHLEQRFSILKALSLGDLYYALFIGAHLSAGCGKFNQALQVE